MDPLATLAVARDKDRRIAGWGTIVAAEPEPTK
jgi:hypothetical protein